MSGKELWALVGPFLATFFFLIFAAREQSNREFAAVLIALACASFGGFLTMSGYLVIKHSRNQG